MPFKKSQTAKFQWIGKDPDDNTRAVLGSSEDPDQVFNPQTGHAERGAHATRVCSVRPAERTDDVAWIIAHHLRVLANLKEASVACFAGPYEFARLVPCK